MSPHASAARAASPESGAPPGGLSLLRMAVGPEVLAVPIDEVREILQVARLTPLPRTPGFVRGVMNLRGSVVPVIDLGARLGQAPAEVGRRSCVVIVQPAFSDSPGEGPPLVMGLLVDAVFEVFDRPLADVEPVPALGTRIEPGFLQGMTRAAGEVIGILALSQVLSPATLSALIARHGAH